MEAAVLEFWRDFLAIPPPDLAETFWSFQLRGFKKVGRTRADATNVLCRASTGWDNY
jgi:hypothetical protein